MTETIQRFFAGVNGKTVVFCGIARNHIPLIPLFLSRCFRQRSKWKTI